MTEATETKRGPGRPQLYTKRMTKISVRLPEDLRHYAFILGGGEIGAGIRAALKFTREWKKRNSNDGTDGTDAA